jgi:soluble lytic murein transglycosylase-like protein
MAAGAPFSFSFGVTCQIAARSLLIFPVALASLIFTPGRALAEVLELGPAGEVTTYDRPFVFGADGATPIATSEGRASVRTRRADPAALQDASRRAALSPDLVAAVAEQESGLRPRVISRAGAVGEMQLMPATARALGVDPRDTGENYRGGAVYLAQLLRRYDGDTLKALAAYNAGAGAVDRYGGVPPFKETQAYVAAVLNRLSQRAEQATK